MSMGGTAEQDGQIVSDPTDKFFFYEIVNNLRRELI
jgi:hypothetical protein